MSSNECRHLVLLGGGGHATVVAEAARLAGWEVRGFFDDDPDRGIAGLTRRGAIPDAGDWLQEQAERICVFPAVGDGRLREAWMDALDGWHAPVIIHPSAAVSGTARNGQGVLIGLAAVVNAHADVGRGCIINSAAVVEHDCRIGDFTHIAPGATLGGEVSIGAHALIGIGAVILPGVSVGEAAVVGAGSTVTDNVDAGVTVAGSPARARDASR